MLDEDSLLYYKGKEIISLTLLETRIMSLFIKNKDAIIPLKVIAKSVYGECNENSIFNLRAILFKLKHKLEGELAFIPKNARGYKLIYIGERRLTK